MVKTAIKQHSESIESFKKGNRQDLVEKEEKELLILQEFVPEQMTPAELSGEVDEAIRQLEAKTPKDMGRVMKFLMEKHAARIDGKVLSEMVRQRLVYTEVALKRGMIDKTLFYIDYLKLLDVIKAYASTSFIDDLVSSLRPAASIDEIETRQDRLEAILELIKWNGHVPLTDIPDVRRILVSTYHRESGS